MEPELEWRRRPGCCWVPLPCDETEAFRTIRFVTVSPTGVGVGVWVRSAAAAAALERAPLDSRSLRKAFVAAREADALGVLLEACVYILAACWVMYVVCAKHETAAHIRWRRSKRVFVY